MGILGSGSIRYAGAGRQMKKPAPSSAAASKATCQRCLQTGHWTYECPNPPAYSARPSRTEQLLNPKIRPAYLDPEAAIAPAVTRLELADQNRAEMTGLASSHPVADANSKRALAAAQRLQAVVTQQQDRAKRRLATSHLQVSQHRAAGEWSSLEQEKLKALWKHLELSTGDTDAALRDLCTLRSLLLEDFTQARSELLAEAKAVAPCLDKLGQPDASSVPLDLEGAFNRLLEDHQGADVACKENLQARFDDLQSQAAPAGKAQAGQDLTRPLKQAQHLRYMDARRECARSDAGATVERLAAMLPEISVPELKAHDAWYRQQLLRQGRASAECESSRAASQAFLKEAQQALAHSARAGLARAQAAEAAAVLQARQQELHATLASMHEARQETEAAELKKQEALQKMSLEAEQARSAAELVRRTQEKQQVAEFQAARADAKQQEADQAAAAQEAVLQEAREQQPLRCSRIAYRMQLLEQRQASHRAQLEELEQQDQEREERLARLRSKVAVSADRDPERAMAPTQSSGAEAPDSPCSPFSAPHSFTTEHLLQDQRFKLLEALGQHDLHASPAGKRALMHTAPLAAPRRDTASHNIFSLQ
ncbi:hypothetical protein WJX73_005255 [Symbiochloris irregularis]|uniref:CCHC-type domain-containing protein n=1 Tax=Symbiochloris irregularis TaxID=706552 RepID=A0AAW1PQ77_9CHLO